MWLFACSGPGAIAEIQRNIAIGSAHAGIVGALLLASLGLGLATRRWLGTAICAGLLALHPAWTVSALDGDCGDTKRWLSWAFSGFALAVVVWQAVQVARRRRGPRAALSSEGPGV